MKLKYILKHMAEKVNEIIYTIYNIETYIGSKDGEQEDTLTYRIKALEERDITSNNGIDIEAYNMILHNATTANRIKIPNFNIAEDFDKDNIQEEVILKYYFINKPYLNYIDGLSITGVNDDSIIDTTRESIILANYFKHYDKHLANKHKIVLTGINDSTTLTEPTINEIIINKYLKNSITKLNKNKLLIRGVNDVVYINNS